MNLNELLDRLSFELVRKVLPSSVPDEFRSLVGKEFPLQSDLRRSIVWLTTGEADLLGIDTNGMTLLEPGQEDNGEATHLVFGNFRHNEDHWIAVAPLTSVQHVIIQQEVFLRSPVFKRPLAAHGQIRFLMDDEQPCLLYPQEPHQAGMTGQTIDDFIASAEAVPPKIEGFPDYSLIGGAKGWYRQSLRFISTGEKAQNIAKKGNSVNQFLLALKPGEARKVFVESIRRSHEIGMDLDYNTLAIGGTQCVYEMFNILDRAVLDDRKENPVTASIWRYFDRMPLFVGRYLKRRGLTFAEAKHNHFPSLEKEMSLTPDEKEKLEARLDLLANSR